MKDPSFPLNAKASLAGSALAAMAGVIVGAVLARISSRAKRAGLSEERKQVESADVEASVFAEDSLRRLIDTIPALVWKTSPFGLNEYANQRLLEYSGGSLASYSGDGWQQLIHPDDLRSTLEAWNKALLERGTYRAMFRFRRFDGVYRWFDVRGEPFQNAAGEVLCWYGILFDVEDRKQAEEALRKTLSRLARATQAATVAELSAAIAHEINQPLAAILANSEACRAWLLKSPPNLDRAMLTNERVVRDGKAAAEVVSRIRRLFQQAGPQKEPMDLNEAIQEVISLLKEDITKRGITITLELDDAASEIVADRIQMQQVLTNLITNAVEAMEDTLAQDKRLQLHSALLESGRVRVQVIDAGKGTPNPDEIIEPFYTTKRSGMGMGLAISRAIIESHDGQLWATANRDAGLTVAFTIPNA